MIIPKLAFRNMMAAGAKTWLNAAVLSMAYVTIIWAQGLYIGLDAEASRAMVNAEYGGGQYWEENYDPFDPFTLQNAHRPLTGPMQILVEKGQATPILIVQGTAYPAGRILPALLKGIEPEQKILSIPSAVLARQDDIPPALIGSRMAAASGLSKGDIVTVRWRDANGTFDAKDVEIVEVMSTIVQSIDSGQVWLPLRTLQDMAGMPSQATIVVTANSGSAAQNIPGWNFRDLDYLLQDVKALVQGKTIGASIIYTLLLFLAMLAIFNTQLLSIWRRRKEIGTMMAMGLSRGKIIGLFTFEGALSGVMASLVGAIYGIPILAYFAAHGFSLGKNQGDAFGFALSENLYPTYSLGLVAGTTFLIFVFATIVSFLPTRKIARLKPTDALRGKLK